MPTKRRKSPPRRINQPMPDWVDRLKAGERPLEGSEGHGEFIGWLYLGDEVPGLPDPLSPDGAPLWRCCDAD